MKDKHISLSKFSVCFLYPGFARTSSTSQYSKSENETMLCSLLDENRAQPLTLDEINQSYMIYFLF